MRNDSQMEKSHIVTAFDNDLGQIESLLLEMAGRVESQIAEATEALVKRDTELGEKVRSDDERVDRLETEIDELVVRLLTLRQPMADDLRNVITASKVAANLERIGDYAKNIAKRTTVLAQEQPIGPAVGTIKRMSSLTQGMLRDVVDALVARDLDTAIYVRQRDEEVDQLHNTLFRELLTYMMEDPRNITPCMHLLFVAKNVERVGDHITSIAEQVHYMICGEMPPDERPKGDVTSFFTLDRDNPRNE